MEILEFIEKSVLQEIQDLFSTSTGLAAIAVDNKGNYITEGSNFTEFCMDYTRKSQVGKERCEKCDAECSGTYFCHAGLMDFSEEIVVNGQVLGTIIGGQVLPEEPDLEKFRGIARELGISEDAYVKAVEKVPVKSEEAIRASAKMLGQIVNLVVNLQYIKQHDVERIEFLTKEMDGAVSTTAQIQQRTKELESIASKQTVLALNASIEAARAGDAGVGFAVVANQMGALSGTSSKIYGHIKEHSENIAASIKKMNDVLK